MTPLQHLLAVERVRRRLGWDVAVRPTMCLGAIAPDAHRIAEHIDHRALHFRSRKIKDRRLIDFLRNCLRPAVNGPAGTLEFWAGWLCHIIADDIWRHNLQRDVPLLWDGVVHGTDGQSDELRDKYLRECNQLDLAFFSLHQHTVEELREELLAAEPQWTAEPLTLQDLHTWRLTVVQSMLPPLAASDTELEYLTMDFVEQCMFQSEEETFRILEWETDESEFSPIF